MPRIRTAKHLCRSPPTEAFCFECVFQLLNVKDYCNIRVYIYICTTLIYLIISFLVLIIYDRVFQDRQASHTPMRPLQFPTGRKRRLWKLNLQWRAVGQKPATDLAFKYQTTMTQTTKFYQQVLSSYTIITMTLSTSYLVLPHYFKFQTLLAVGVRFHLLGSVVAAALGQRQCQ